MFSIDNVQFENRMSSFEDQAWLGGALAWGNADPAAVGSRADRRNVVERVDLADAPQGVYGQELGFRIFGIFGFLYKFIYNFI